MIGSFLVLATLFIIRKFFMRFLLIGKQDLQKSS